MSLNLIIVLASLVLGIYSLLIGFEVLTTKMALKSAKGNVLKMRQSHKIIGFSMILLFAFNLFKLLSVGV